MAAEKRHPPIRRRWYCAHSSRPARAVRPGRQRTIVRARILQRIIVHIGLRAQPLISTRCQYNVPSLLHPLGGSWFEAYVA